MQQESVKHSTPYASGAHLRRPVILNVSWRKRLDAAALSILLLAACAGGLHLLLGSGVGHHGRRRVDERLDLRVGVDHRHAAAAHHLHGRRARHDAVVVRALRRGCCKLMWAA